MALRILVYDQDPAVRNLLRMYLDSLGHDVHAFAAPVACPVFLCHANPDCDCPRAEACGDVVLIDYYMPGIDACSLLQLQQARGCRVLVANQAVLSTGLTPVAATALQESGCHYIAKPFRLEAVGRWVKECAGRVNRG